MHFSIAIALLSFFTVRKIQWQGLRAGEKINECGKTYIARDRDNYLFHDEFSHQCEFRVSRASALSVLRMVRVPQSRRHQASKDTEDTSATEVSCI